MAPRVRFQYTDGRLPEGRTVEVGAEAAHEALSTEPAELADTESRDAYRAWCERQGVTPATGDEPAPEPETESEGKGPDLLAGTCDDVRERVGACDLVTDLHDALDRAERKCAEEAISVRLDELEA